MEAEQADRYRACPALGAGALASLGRAHHQVTIRGDGPEAEELEQLLTELPEVRVERVSRAGTGPGQEPDLLVDFEDDGPAKAEGPARVRGDHARFLAVTLQAVLDRREGAVRNRCARCAAEYCFGALGHVLVDQLAVLARNGDALLPDLPAIDPASGAYRSVATACYLQRRLEALRQRSEPFTVLGVAATAAPDAAEERRLGRRLDAWAHGRAFLGQLAPGRFVIVLPRGAGMDLLLRGRQLVAAAAAWSGTPPLAVGVAAFAEGTAELDGFGLATALREELDRLEPGAVEQLRA